MRAQATADTAHIDTYRRAGRSPGRRVGRFGATVAALTVTCAAGLVFAPGVDAATSGPPTAENAAARAAILESISAQPDPSVVPEDFVREFGYRPMLEQGILVDPDGGCSSPFPLPREFDLACDAHDLGYDLLRYATAHGQPLGPWARQAADAALARRMHAACEARAGLLSRARCQVMAGAAATAVDLNSARQGYGNPGYEPFFQSVDGLPSPAAMLLAGGGVVAGLGMATTVLVRRRRARRAWIAPSGGRGGGVTSNSDQRGSGATHHDQRGGVTLHGHQRVGVTSHGHQRGGATSHGHQRGGATSHGHQRAGDPTHGDPTHGHHGGFGDSVVTL
ncbi:hypothetical protein [Nocardia stercoris]|uniref:Phospholipase n=1 Tax=Nocardia stercoris TaxID=2483361 RepID=A0A3M2L5C2_9NOCA|nr:hypothetical protein [Nocardia stercoris]RMI32837.1 hypothetical protein EBN03_12995 [Nocardia stercoris]